MAEIELSGVSKIFHGDARVVTDLDLTVEDGELMVLLGPSGCGKTTTLRLTAGLEDVTEGEIRIGGRLVNSLDPRQRDVAMVFQNYALYPHMSVYDNLAFPLRARGLSRGEIRTRVEHVATLLGLDAMLKRKPRALSGGQRQRVAMGRAIVREPQAFLMDEPLSNLDATLRTELRAEIAGLQRELGVTTMYVTHDQLEAMTMGTRIAVLRGGLLQQLGPPQQLYDEPGNLFVATFLGSPMMNLLRGVIGPDGAHCDVGGERLPVPSRSGALARYAGSDVAVGIRPEHLGDSATAPDSQPRMRGRVRFVELLGAEQLVHIELPGRRVVAGEVLDIGSGADATTRTAVPNRVEAGTAAVAARFGAHARIHPGDTVEVAVTTERLHFFDLTTGRAIR
jgi:multiple sugar transport system ATP-binding protein